ncbi:acetate kinase [Staphylococcus sp. EG-SA-6]|jgi:acetate kinase|uniref:Acetate kinase n=2 Tax=Staphylococcus haemolyticus TaxID=1283 RepID=ACKA_STAHJ|nr:MULTISPECIES: acetate kinase [Staphylococcus]Q4L752.1 RecName: Full=Acetate kinase; AltName: Full=Acetokinase [Staphylococcus haemolyticus JCSC1435]KDP54491.1 acetate kinase [Staphylococcus aureus subsp. aureus CO-98]MBN4935326.1 acetate kinase [Staphylococcus sp. EG-SA-6]MDU5817752.1 acetate kinase [Staphylococcus sp.]AMW23638.1 acetate kinase [Staphylococcus haemolyticus]AUV67243.1 acetate kinase [Staphylococcus haemolyticus]
MSSLVLAINAGSSSLKFQLIRMPEETLVTKGLIERIGIKDSIFTIEVNGEKIKDVKDIKDHEEAINIMLDSFKQHGIIDDINDIAGTGHRVVHGGELFPTSALVTDKVEEQIESLSELAPLHNPANLMGIRAFRKLLPNIPHVAVFDTSFHQSMPEQSYLYSLPYQYYKDYGIRKYGFHGTSHKYVSQRAAEIMNKPIEELRIISCHIGNGASIAAIDGGESIDTSMGFTPLAGVTMGTRSGNIDPALIPFIMQKTGQNAEEVLNVLNKESGLLGISGTSSDLRDLESDAEEGKERAQLALDVFASRIHKYIGSYATRMHGVDVIVFTAGVGENSSTVRAKVLEGLEFMGIYWDPKKNETIRGEEGFINYPHSPVKVIVIPTNEEVMIARDTVKFGEL